MKVDRAALARFQRLAIPQPNGCWLWTGPATRDGYGIFKPPGKPRLLAHVWSFQAHSGPIPEGLDLDHACHSNDPECPGGPGCQHRRCCNPAHLEPVTRSENTLRQRHAERGRTHCPNGHPYSGENLVIWRDGKRRCRACLRAR